MRLFKFLPLLFTVTVFTTLAQTLSTSDARQHVGEKRTVCGEIAGEHTAAGSRGTPTFVNLDKPYPHQVFTLLIWGDSRSSVGPLPSHGTVCATGTITLYRGSPEIVLHDAKSWYIPNAQAGATGRYYTNSDGQRVHSPESAPAPPAGATAQCRDGTYSFSQHHSGTCSHHGGVAKWL